MSKALRFPPLLLLALFSGPAYAAELDIPQNVTLTVESDGLSRILWDPIYREDLLGYSVWKRFENSGADFTRLMLPVKIGKETKKMPVTSMAKYAFKDPKGKPAEFVVIAEYEEGRSKPSATLRTRLARRIKPQLGPDADAEAAQASSPTAEAEATPSAGTQSAKEFVKAREEKEAKEAKEAEEAAEAGLEAQQLKRDRRPSIAKPGRLRSWFEVKYYNEENHRRGYSSMDDLGIFDVSGNIAPDEVVSWELYGNRHGIHVPLGLAFGLFPGLEVGGEMDFATEYPTRMTFKARGIVLEQLAPYAENFGTPLLGDATLRVRLAPMPEGPLVLNLGYQIPTGRSRFRAWMESLEGKEALPGNSDGIGRLGLGAEWGDKWSKPGMSYFAQYSPGASETVPFGAAFFPQPLNLQLIQGDRIELGAGYSFPYDALGEKGIVILGAAGRSISAGRFLEGSNDQVAGMGEVDRVEFENITAVSFRPQEQMEFFIESEQYIRKGVSGRGKIAYILKPNGFILSLGGGILY